MQERPFEIELGMLPLSSRGRALLGLVLGALGTSSTVAACGSTTPVDSAFDSGPAEASAPTDAAGGDSPSEAALFDRFSPSRDSGACTDVPLSVEPIDRAAACAGTVDAAALNVSRVCFARPNSGASCDAAYPTECVLSKYVCGLIRGGTFVGCGPLAERPDACCYEVFGSCAVGRPFTVDGRARLATLEGDRGWSSAFGAGPVIEALAETTRLALAEAWTEEARTEHASVASFTRMVLELMSLGAPADLVGETLRAAEDERRHAMSAFALASAYGGTALGPGALDIRGCLSAASAPEIAERLAGEGCIAETVSALLVAEAYEQAKDPAVRAVLERVAEEESAHALLAWKTLAWLLQRESVDRADVHARVAHAFSRAEHYVGIGATPSSGAEEALRAHGQLSANTKRRLARSVLAGVVAPAARTALSRSAAAHVGRTEI